MKGKRKAAALALSAVMACGLFAGCDLVTKDSHEDFKQVIATVNISKSEDFAEGGEFAGFGTVLGETQILKRDMVASFVSSGYSAMNTYGWSYKDTFKAICDSLVNRQIYVQYAKAYLLKNGDDQGNKYSVTDYTALMEKADIPENADLEYFLSKTEKEQALYATRKLFNNTIDSQERSVINATTTTEDSKQDTTVRERPDGVDTENSDYYDTEYRIYTGSNSASKCGSYQTLDDSTSTTRRKAFNDFLSSLRKNDLLDDGEDTTNFEGLSYFSIELRSQYETAMVNKLNAAFEEKAKARMTEMWIASQFDKTYQEQKRTFGDDPSTFEGSFDKISDSEFYLTAPEAGYGYVINILLPFSKAQSNYLTDAQQDYGDPKGNSFEQRSAMLKLLLATDQRGTWFTGETDYSFDASADSSTVQSYYDGGNAERKYLFFENGLVKDYSSIDNDATKKNYTDRYETIKNYYGRYAYNGKVSFDEAKGKYSLTPNKIDIDGFLGEMEEYLAFAGLTSNGSYVGSVGENGEIVASSSRDQYYNRKYYDYYKLKKGETEYTANTVDYNSVDYSKFMYYAGKVDFEDFDANKLFVAGSQENTAFSVMKELSYAYNTDTAGLDDYLGYSTLTGKTTYVSEFEYAAQWACAQGAGSYCVVPSTYGWHIIYCTFSFTEKDGEIKPFTFDYNEALDTKGSFSNLYYETLKKTLVSNYTTHMQTSVVNALDNEACVTVYENRFADLSSIGS